MLFDILARLEADPVFTAHININTVIQYLDLASWLKNDILLTQDAKHDPKVPPAVLPPSISKFLAAACDIPSALVSCFWDNLKDTVWSQEKALSTKVLFEKHGYQ
ncbi:hypothetical protein C8J56DRAFT_1050874 [Mycena floridula]|nr:hypothetical protein C8J56DRAFT_1050874 [Mycena floridula]